MWEANRSNLSVDYNQKLGSGCFSIVYKGYITGEAPVVKALPVNTTNRYALLALGITIVFLSTSAALKNCAVAVKMLPQHSSELERTEFLKEIAFMKVIEALYPSPTQSLPQDLGYHRHLVSMIGCITVDEPHLLLTEFCEHGDLLKILKSNAEDVVEVRICCAIVVRSQSTL